MQTLKFCVYALAILVAGLFIIVGAMNPPFATIVLLLSWSCFSCAACLFVTFGFLGGICGRRDAVAFAKKLIPGLMSLGGIAVFTYLAVTGPNQFWPIGLFLIGYALLMVQLYRYMHKDVVE